jgi:hypothetical protein
MPLTEPNVPYVHLVEVENLLGFEVSVMRLLGWIKGLEKSLKV